VLSRFQPFSEYNKGQLGLSQFPETTFSDVPFPVELHLPGVSVVSLAASQASVQTPFLVLTGTLTYTIANRALHALGADGSVYVWGEGAFNPFHLGLKSPGTDNPSWYNPGTLNRRDGPEGPGFSSPYTTTSAPLKLQLPAPTRSIR